TAMIARATALPSELQPTSTEVMVLPSGRMAAVPKCAPVFLPWNGAPVPTYGGKQLLNVDGDACFAELAILRALQRHGWEGAWIDNFGRKMRVDLPSVGGTRELTASIAALLASIGKETGVSSGCWDVVCSKANDVLFCEAKRHKKDRLRKSQLAFL